MELKAIVDGRYLGNIGHPFVRSDTRAIQIELKVNPMFMGRFSEDEFARIILIIILICFKLPQNLDGRRLVDWCVAGIRKPSDVRNSH